ncbi:MAG: 3-deoxy-manno-octulosonate cytidylyltransferase [Candidatus Cloacimonetes bacterium]|nr:3-deoxy-manno-octulosonate cytidylyltransferase [Candidatus Cloacimonadota bacterium]
MNVIAIIPARYNSTRLHGKPLKLLTDRTLIQHVYESVASTEIFSEVIVATDDQRIFDHVVSFGGIVEMTSPNHKSGTDRIAEVCQEKNFDLVINIQGDEPFISKEPLHSLINLFSDKMVQIASLMHILTDDISNPNSVKVVCNRNNFALYFSRSVIPFNRDKNNNSFAFKHIGVYAFRRKSLFEFINLPLGKLENIEKLEQLRLLENGIPIKMVETDYKGFGIDTLEDLEKARKMFI